MSLGEHNVLRLAPVEAVNGRLGEALDPARLDAREMAAALARAEEQGFTHVIALPASGASDPASVPALLSAAAANPGTVVAGCRTGLRGWRAGAARLSVRLETGLDIADPGTVFAVYPLAPLKRLAGSCKAIPLGAELLVRLAWGGVPAHGIAVNEAAGGGSADSPWHSLLLLRRLAPWPHPRFTDRPPEKTLDFRHPVRLLREILAEHASPRDLGIACFVGVFMGALPLLACHTVAILYVTTRLRLNRAMAIAAQNICAPPVVPVLCVEVGYMMRHGAWLTEVSRQTVLHEFHLRLLEWFLGSLIVGPVLGAAAGLIVFGSAGLLARRGRAAQPAKIGDRKRGNRLGYLSFHVALRMFGKRGAYGLLYMVVLYYVLFDRTARRLAAPYLGRRFPGHAGFRRMRDVYRLFYSQGVSLIDRYRMLARGGDFRQLITGYDLVKPMVEDRGKGFVLLVSHVGNWQALMLALRRMDRGITLLMKAEENAVVQEYLQIGDGRMALRVVSPDSPMGGVVELTDRFMKGDVIAVMGDRAYGAATLPVEFMGGTAHFPCGPFQLAAAWDCPVAVLFTAKTGDDEYTVEIADLIRVGRTGPRRENLQRAMQGYAKRLEDFSARHPYQVYLFEDVWQAP